MAEDELDDEGFTLGLRAAFAVALQVPLLDRVDRVDDRRENPGGLPTGLIDAAVSCIIAKGDDQKTLDVASRFTTKNREKKTVTKEITTKIEVEIDEDDLLAYLDTMAGVLDKMRFIKRAVESLTDHDIEKMADFLADQSADAESVRIFNLLNDLRAKLLELKCPKQQ